MKKIDEELICVGMVMKKIDEMDEYGVLNQLIFLNISFFLLNQYVI